MAATTIEKTSPELFPFYPELAYHFGQALVFDREHHYALLAGEQALVRFNNHQACQYYERALELTPMHESKVRFNLLLTLFGIHELLGNRAAQQKCIEKSSVLAEIADDDKLRTQVLLKEAALQEVISEFDRAIGTAKESIALAENSNQPQFAAEGYLHWAKALRSQSKGKAAAEQFKNAIYKAEAIGAEEILAESKTGLAMSLLFLGKLDPATDQFNQALSIYRRLGNGRGEAQCLNGLCIVHSWKSEHDIGLDYLHQSRDISHKIGDRLGESRSYLNLGVKAHDDRKAYVEGSRYAKQSLRIKQEINDRVGMATCNANLGIYYMSMGNFEEALQFTEKSLELCLEINNQSTYHRRLPEYAHMLSRLQEKEKAWEVCQQAYKFSLKNGDRGLEGVAKFEMGQILLDANQLNEAYDVLLQAYNIVSTSIREGYTLEVLAVLTMAALKMGNLEQAKKNLPMLIQNIDKSLLIHDSRTPLNVPFACYKTFEADGDPRAVRLLEKMYNHLTQVASQFENIYACNLFLENIPAHREIVKLFQSLK